MLLGVGFRRLRGLGVSGSGVHAFWVLGLGHRGRALGSGTGFRRVQVSDSGLGLWDQVYAVWVYGRGLT